CATGYYVSYPFLPPELQRVQGSVVQCYGGAFLADYQGLYYVAWYQPRSGLGKVISPFAPIFARYLKLQDEITVPIGLVLKEMGYKLPNTHLFDPQRILQELKYADRNFASTVKKAHQLEQKYPNFFNQPLAAPEPKRSLSTS
ncbi:MAG: flavin-containing monooxygenase, partial [Waterburya sp.]